MICIKATTHFLGGMVAGYKAYPTITGAIVGGVAGLLPDIDDNRSFIGRVFFFVSWPLRHIIGHRTLFHSWIPVVILAILTVLWPGGISLALLIGFISHIILDMLVGRVQMLYPLGFKIGIPMPYFIYVVVDLIVRLGLAAFVLWYVWNEFISKWF